MPDNETTFTEILSISADQSEFQKSLDTLTSAYNAWVANLGEGAGANIGQAGITQALADMKMSLSEFGIAATELLRNFVLANAGAATQVTAASDESTQKQVENAETVAAAVGTITRAQVQLAEQQRRNAELTSKGTGAAAEDETLNRAAAQVKLAQDRVDSITSANSGTLNSPEVVKLLAGAYQDLNSALKTQADLLTKIFDLTEKQRSNQQAQAIKVTADAIALETRERERNNQVLSASIDLEEKKRAARQFQTGQVTAEAIAKEAADREKANQAEARSIDLDEAKRASQQFQTSQVVSNAIAKEAAERAKANELEARSIDLDEKKRQTQAAQGQKVVTDTLAKAKAEVDALTLKSERLEAQLVKVNERLSIASLNNNLPAQIDLIKNLLTDVEAKLRAIDAQKLNLVTGDPAASNKLKEDELAQKDRQLLLTNNLSTAQNKLTQETERTGKASKSILDNIISGTPKAIAQLAAFQIQWALISAVIGGIVGIIEAPFKAIADGVKYLQQTQEAAAALVGPLQANVKFAGDLVENFRAAQEQATLVERALQAAATRTQIPVEQLRDQFKAVLESGGQALGNTLQDTIDLAVKLSVVYRSMGAETVNNNKLLQQTRQFIEGGLSPATSLYLQLTHQTVEQYMEMVRLGLEHHDILKSLPETVQETVSGMQTMAVTQESLTKQIGLYIKQLEGDAAGSIFTKYGDILKDLLAWLQNHHDEIVNILDAFAGSLRTFLGLLTDSPSIVAGAVSSFSTLALIIDHVATGFSQLVIDARALNGFRLSSNVEEFSAASEKWAKDTKENHDATVAFQKALEDLNKTKDNSLSKEYQAAIGNSLGSDPQTSPTGLNQPVTSKTPPNPPKSELKSRIAELQADKEAFISEMNDIKEKYAALNAAINQQVADGTKNRRQAATEVSANIKREIDDVKNAITEFNTEASNVQKNIDKDSGVGSTPDARDKATLEVNRARSTAALDTNKAISEATGQGTAAIKAALSEEEKERIDAGNKALALIKQQLTEKLALIKAGLSEGLLTQVEAIDQEQFQRDRAHEQELHQIALEVQQDNTGAKNKQKLLETLKASDDAYTAASVLSAAQRVKAGYDETLAKQDFANKNIALDLKQAQMMLELNGLEYGSTAYNSAQQELLNAHEQELTALQQQKAAQLEVALAKNVDTEETRKLALSLRELSIQQQQDYISRVQQIKSQVSNTTYQRTLIDDANTSEGKNLQDKQKQAQSNLSAFAGSVDSNPNNLNTQEVAAKMQVLVTQLDLADIALAQFSASTKTSASEQMKAALEKTFLGPGFFASFDANQKAIAEATDAHTHITDVTAKHTAEIQRAITVTSGISSAFVNLVGIISKVQQGLSSGGVLGGAGAAASAAGGILGGLKGMFGKDSPFNAIPLVGQALSALGPILSIVGDMFTAQARKIGEQVKKSFSDTVTAFQNGNTDLADTIISLEQQRASAIAQLSGKKGGQDQLNSLLPQFDNEIASLLKQQKDLITNFNQANAQLQMQSTTLAGVAAQWIAINKQVSDYLAAGGDAVTAAQTLALTLQQIQQTAQTALGQGNQTAISDAENLNSLYLQRSQLLQTIIQQTDSYNATQFGLENADSLERMKAGSVLRGQQIADNAAAFAIQKGQSDAQLASLNTQISLAQKKVDLESSTFKLGTDNAQAQADNAAVLAAYQQEAADIANGTGITIQDNNALQVALAQQLHDLTKSTTDLQNQSNKLTIDALTTQIQQWTDLKTIINGITLTGPPGPNTGATGTGVTGPINNTFNYTVNVNGSGLSQQQTTDAVTAALANAQRTAQAYTY